MIASRLKATTDIIIIFLNLYLKPTITVFKRLSSVLYAAVAATTVFEYYRLLRIFAECFSAKTAYPRRHAGYLCAFSSIVQVHNKRSRYSGQDTEDDYEEEINSCTK